ncbi:putative serine/threonine-protein kinase-like protein CCR3 [Bienertia sinuspersici]
MTINSPFSAIFVSLFFLSLPHFINSLGSGLTLSISSSTSTVCGIVAGEVNRRIECYKNGRLISIQPNISYDAIVGGGSFFCGLRSGGRSLLCWDTATNSSTFPPKRIYFSNDSPLKEISVGNNQVCGIVNKTNEVKCWRGMMGSDQIPSRVNGFQSISSGFGFSCGILMNSTKVRCWGSNETLASEIESQFRNHSMVSLTAGGQHVCGFDSFRFLICKGMNFSGQLNFPSALNDSSEFSSLALGLDYSCAIRQYNGSVICWGDNGAYLSNITKGINFEFLVGGFNFVCGLITRNSSISCWGPGWLGFRRQRSGTSSTKHPDRAEEFTFQELASATDDFSLENKIGAGSFGVVYRGKLADGRVVAIKRGETGPKTKKYQEKESAFESELAFLSRVHHKHLVRLVGYCEERDERLLVYEYMKNGALYDHLHDKKNIEKGNSVVNAWKIRIKIALDAARDYAVPAILAGELLNILDPRVGPPESNESEAVELVAYTALHCVNLEGKDRPTMNDIVANLERAWSHCDDSHGSISSAGIISIESD